MENKTHELWKWLRELADGYILEGEGTQPFNGKSAQASKDIGHKLHSIADQLSNQKQAIEAYQECYVDHQRLVREIDVIISGEDGAAKQASLCDLVGQIKGIMADLLKQKSEIVRLLYVAGSLHPWDIAEALCTAELGEKESFELVWRDGKQQVRWMDYLPEAETIADKADKLEVSDALR